MLSENPLTDVSLANLSIAGTLPSVEEVMGWFKSLGAGWVHDGDPKKPHAILHSGKHSTGFFLCKRVLAHGNLREVIAACIISELRKAGLTEVHGVFGSPYSSILLAGDVGRLLGVKTYVPEKDPFDSCGKKMRFKPDDPIPHGAVMLQIEELVTTWDSGDATTKAIVLGNLPNCVKFAPQVGVFVHRPPRIGHFLPDGRIIVPFIEKAVYAWDPDDCPLCKKDSPAVFPKTQWAELTE